MYVLVLSTGESCIPLRCLAQLWGQATCAVLWRKGVLIGHIHCTAHSTLHHCSALLLVLPMLLPRRVWRGCDSSGSWFVRPNQVIVAKLLERFAADDADGDGEISKPEFVAFITRSSKILDRCQETLQLYVAAPFMACFTPILHTAGFLGFPS